MAGSSDHSTTFVLPLNSWIVEYGDKVVISSCSFTAADLRGFPLLLLVLRFGTRLHFTALAVW